MKHAPTTTVTTEPTLHETTVPPTPDTTDPDTTDPDTTDPDTTDPDTTDPEPTDPEPTESVPAGPFERSEILVAAANGANASGTALRVATELEGLGYVDVLQLNGTDIVPFTTIYFADGFEESALRMAEDLQLPPDFVAPIDESPGVADLPADTELLVYIGRDRA